MQIGRIQGATRVIGQRQGYLGLPVRDITVNCTVNGPDTPAMETAWLPDSKDIEAIIVGAPIILRLLGDQHPPVMVRAGDGMSAAIQPQMEVELQSALALVEQQRARIQELLEHISVLSERTRAAESGVRDCQAAVLAAAQLCAKLSEIAGGTGR